MVTTVVLATCDIHRVPETAQAIADLPEVSEVYSVAGDYDLVIMVRVREHEELARVVTEGIAKVPAVERASKVFGIANIGVGRRVAQDIHEMGAVALELMEAEPFESFAVRARRSHSTFGMKSSEINEIIGQRIKDATGATVRLKDPGATAYVE